MPRTSNELLYGCGQEIYHILHSQIYSKIWVASTPLQCKKSEHDNVIKWKHFPRYWPFVRGTHRWPVNSPHKSQWHGALVFSLICACINGWVNNRKAGDLRCHRAHYDVTVMIYLQVRHASYFWALSSFQMCTGPLFQIKLHLLSTVSLSGFQSSLGALKSTK